MAKKRAKEKCYRINVTVDVKPDGDQFTGYCPELGTASCGDTYEEAEKNIEEAVVVDIMGLIEVGTLEDFFKERGVKFEVTKPVKRPKKVVIETVASSFSLELAFCA